MTERASFQVINPPNRLAIKVPRHGGPDLQTIVRDAEAALRELSESYDEWIRADIATLEDLLDQAVADGTAAPKLIDRIFVISHEIKGQGATFEFPLLTLIAESLCTLIETSGEESSERLKLIGLHIDALKVVVNENIRGAGGDSGKEMIAMLRMAVEKARLA